jgi:hypothetical protein
MAGRTTRARANAVARPHSVGEHAHGTLTASVPTLPSPLPPDSPWRVVIRERGRSGSVDYAERENSLSLYWEFGGSVVAIIAVPRAAEWDARHAWAAGRMPEIMARIGAELVRQRAPGCTFEADPNDPRLFYVREARGR